MLTARRAGSFVPHPTSVAINWSAPLRRVYLVSEAFAGVGDVAVSEINYDPAEPTAAEKAAVLEVAATDFEYVELKNVGSRTVNTFEMKFAEGLPFKELKLAPRTLGPGETALVVRRREAFVARYGSAQEAKIVGEWSDGSLNDGGETIQLQARDGSAIQSFVFGDSASGGASANLVGGVWKSDVPSPGTDGPTYAAWKNFHFPAGGAASADTADADLDDADNRTEYAHATNPTVADSQAAFTPTFALSGSNYVFTFKKPLNRPSAQYQVQQSGDLAQCTNMADALVSASLGVETRAAGGPAGNFPMRFFRLRTTVGP